GVRRFLGIGHRQRADLVAVAGENAELQPALGSQSRQHGHVAPAIRRPVLGDHQHLRRAVRLRHDPLPRLALGVGEPRGLERLAEEVAVVLARHAERAFTLQILRRADELHVLIERHTLREPFRGHHCTGSLCSPKTSFIARLISPRVAYAFTASTMAGIRLMVPRASSERRASAAPAARWSGLRRSRVSLATCVAATAGSKAKTPTAGSARDAPSAARQ